MRRRNSAILASVLLVAAVSISLWRVAPPLPQDSPASLENLRQHVSAIAAEPHPVGSAANHRVRDYVLGELRALGLEPQVQPGTITNRRGREFLVENIVCVLRADPESSTSNPAALLVSHYDSHPRAPGAGDDANAVASMLEVARLLVAGPPPRRNIVLLFTDGEEYGLLGAQAWVRDNPDFMGCRVVANFEARGTSGAAIMFETAGAPIDLFRNGYVRRSPHAVTSSLASPVYERMPNGTDFTVFKLAGMSGLNFAFIDGVHNYHTPGDIPENLADASLLHQAAQMHEVALYLSTADDVAFARNLGEGELDLVYFDLLGLTVIFYPSRLAGPLAIVAAFVSAIGIWRVHPRADRLGPALLRLLLGLVIVVAWTALAFLLPMQTPMFRWTPAAFAGAGAVCLAVLPFTAARGVRSWREATALTLAVFASAALATGLLFPPASYALLIPTLALGLAAAVSPRRARPMAFAVAAAVSTIVLLPLAWLVTVALTIRLLAIPAALLVLVSWLWLPALLPLLQRRWTIAGGFAATAIVCFAIVFLA